MASTKTAPAPTETVQAQGEAPVTMTRAAFMESMTFAEALSVVLTSARWADILQRADDLAKVIDAKDSPIREKTLSSQLRKVATLAPSKVAAFRLAIVSYQLAGHRSNPTQNAELAAKLPTLRKQGALKQGAISFGELALPPSIGEF